jgi:hypothetical protein
VVVIVESEAMDLSLTTEGMAALSLVLYLLHLIYSIKLMSVEWGGLLELVDGLEEGRVVHPLKVVEEAAALTSEVVCIH